MVHVRHIEREKQLWWLCRVEDFVAYFNRVTVDQVIDGTVDSGQYSFVNQLSGDLWR